MDLSEQKRDGVQDHQVRRKTVWLLYRLFLALPSFRTRTADWFSLKDEEEPAQTHRVELEDSQFGAPSGKINNSEVAKKETLDNKEAMPEM